MEADSQNAQQPNRSRQFSVQVQPPSLPSVGTGLLQSSSSGHQQQLHSKLGIQMPLNQETPQPRVALSNPLMTEWPKSAFSQPPRFQNPSPNKIKVKTSTYDKEFTEQLAEFKVLDKIMPCLDHVQGVFVQIAKSLEFATVLGFDGKHLLTLKTESNQVLEVPVNSIKFLAGAYVHPLSEIAMANASDPLAIDLALNDQSKIDKSVILIQTISNPISQDEQTSVGSIHRFHAIVLNGLTGKMTLHPVQFQNSQKHGKRQQKQSISAEEDTSKDNYELFAYQNQEVTRRILEFSRRIHAAYRNYKSKVQSIQLTAENQQTLLNSVCAVYDHMTDENVCKYGVLTKVAAKKAFIRYFRTKAEWDNEPIQQWLNFDKVNIEADLTLGFVSKSTLFQRSIFDQKLRNVKFVSQLESITQDKTQPECINCANCQAGSPDLIFCKRCNFSVHYECLDDEYKQQLEPYKNLQFDDFKCQNCIFCQQCGSQEADQTGGGTWSSDFQLCSPCEKKREKKMFCIGCLQFWQESEGTREMIQCSCCQMKVHPGCDRMLEDSIHLKQLQHKDENGKPTTLYACFSCRQKARADFIGQIVNYMISEDKREEFRYPFWQQPNNASYLTVIKTPLCFNMIKQEIDEFVLMPHSGHLSQIPELKYLSKPEKLGQDIDLLFWNAKTFNQPQTDIYKLSLRMHEKCTQILNQGRIKEILKDNSLATHDELLHLKFLRGSKTIEPEYKLKPKDLFQMHEQIDVNQYLYMLKSIEETNQTVSLGKRQRENQQTGGQKRQRLDEGEIALTQDIDMQFTDTRKIFMVANKRLLEQNLSKLRLNQSTFQNLQVDKSHYNTGANEVASLHQSPRSKWKALMDSLRLSDELDSDWYSNPVRISFDDPSLIFEEMCYLCGSFGLREEFLCCNFCSESFHPYCLPYPKEITQIDKNGWKCFNCVFCEKCHSSKQYEGLVLCSVCDKATHYWCMQPQLVELPECSWKCPDCFKCRACGTKEFFSAEDIENKVNLDPNQRYTLCFNFEFCFQCGQDQYRKSFCKICDAKTGLGLTPQNQQKNYATQVQSQVDQKRKTAQKEEISPENSADLLLPNEVPPQLTSLVLEKEQITTDQQCEAIDLFKCSTCKYYSHLSCSRTNRSAIKQLSQTSYFRGFQCLDCILSEKLPGFYLHEQCELYEDMHVRMEKFQLMNQLCITILQKYTKGQNFMIEQYVTQNFQWLSTSPVVMKWIQLLRSEVDYETSENSQTEQSALQSNQTVLPFSGLKGLTELYQNEIDTETAIPKNRDLYLNLYKKVNGFEERTESISAIEFSEEWLKPNQIDFAEIYVSVEMVAITRIRSHFFNWVQDKVVGPAIEH